MPAHIAPSSRRGNALVLVTAILVLLVILATAFLVRARSTRAQSGAENRAAGRTDRTAEIADAVAQQVADSLFVRPVDQSSYPLQVNANTAAGLTGVAALMPRPDYPRLPADPQAIRYGIDYFDALNNSTLAAGSDYILDGVNYAPFSVIPWTNWPDWYAQLTSDGTVLGEGNPFGNPGFGDTRWLRSTEPVRALTMRQTPYPSLAVPPAPPNSQTAAVPPTNNWGNLALVPVPGEPTGVPVLSPEGLGFSHWAHLSWLPTAENGYRVCYDISDLEQYTLAGFPGSPAGLAALGVPYEQWPTNVPPREVGLAGKDSRGFLVLARSVVNGQIAGDFVTRRNNWFTNYANTLITTPLNALPNFFQLSAFGDPSDDFKFEPAGSPLAGQPTSRALISRTFADADGDGFTDSLWFVAPASSDRDTRQVVGISIIDNTGLLNVNVASRFERTSTIGGTPADVALVSRGVSLDPSVYVPNANPADGNAGADQASDDVAVGFLDSRENHPEYRVGRTDPGLPSGTANYLLYGRTANAGVPTSGVDTGFNPARYEGWRSLVPQPAVNGESNQMPGLLQSLGVIRAQGTAATSANQPVGIFNPTFSVALAAPGGSSYGGWFPLTKASDRLTYFKTQANGGVLVDPVTSGSLAVLTPFGWDDEVELRAFNGLNNAPNVSRLEMALGSAAPVVASGGGAAAINSRDFLRGSRTMEESVRYLAGLAGNQPNDPRNFDARARLAWTGQNTAMAASGAAQLVLDHRRQMTTYNGARNEMMPPRLWTVIDPSAPSDLTRVRPAYVHRGVDFNHDGSPDDVNGDGTVNAADDLPPYHPFIVYFNATPRGDGNGDGVVNNADFELARQEFMRRNRKIDLRRPVDVPAANGTPATNAAILQAERDFRLDIQRVLRRALIDEDTRGSYFLDGSPAGASAQKINDALLASKMMAASMAANIGSYRDGERQISGTLWLDGPTHPDDATPLPSDAIPDAQYTNARFIGVEKQPFLQEVFMALVFPKTKLTQTELDNVTGPAGAPNSGCPDASGCQLDAGDPAKLPPCTDNGAGEHFVTYDPADPSTWPAVVFVAQIANPYNTPVNLADFELRINPATGAPQRFFFGLPGPTGTRSGNTYGPDVELGPCTPEEPRTAIVFCVPEKFPNGDPFPRDAWLDYLDIGAPISETNPANDVKPGQFFVPDSNAIFQPAWGGPSAGSTAFWDNNKRLGTLYFDATRTAAPLPVWNGGFEISGNLARWQPAQSAGGPPPSSFIELRRALYPATGGTPTWTVVDRLDNELDNQDQIFRDTLGRLFTPEHLPPQKDIACRQGKLSISGVRIRSNDYFVTWARGARQWLFDTQNNVAGTPLGKGQITLDERTPRYAFSRLTGVERVQEVQSDSYNGGVQQPVKGTIFAEGDAPDGAAGGQPWFVMNYVNQWAENKRGKPTFFPTRIIEQQGGLNRLYNYPVWLLNNAAAPSGTILSYGEKGVTDAKFVNGTNTHNFMAPYRFFQKDADFDQVGEILDVPLWGPLVEAAVGGGSGRTYATLAEILAQEPDTTATLKFPKAPAGANLAYWNRLQLDPAKFDVTPGPGGRPNLLSGVPVVPSPVGFISPQQAGLSLLDAFTVDDRGSAPFDANNDGVIDFGERAVAENRRLRLAQGFLGKPTPGLINVNTAPLEVMRAMPYMMRLVYNDDREPHTRARMHVLNFTGSSPQAHVNLTPDEKGAFWDYGAPAPRVHVAEAIDLWRNKGNVTPALGATVSDPSIPSYFTRGLDLPDAQNNLELAPGLRRERGFDSLGELALLVNGAHFANPASPAAADVGNSWNQTASWSMRYGGLDPMRVSYTDPSMGTGVYSQWAAGNAHKTDGIPKSSPVASVHKGIQDYPLSGRTGVDPHLLQISSDDRSTTTGPNAVEPTHYRYDSTAGDALEQNQLLKAISNIATVRSDVFTVYLKVRTIKRNPITGRWDATDPDYILDDSRYVMGVDRSQVDRPGEKPRILYFAKVPN